MRSRDFLSLLKSYTGLAKPAFNWFVQTVQNLYKTRKTPITGPSLDQLLGEPDSVKTEPPIMDYTKAIVRTSGAPEIGKMYLFRYDARHKDILPFFDMHPLVFPIDYWANKQGERGFIGLNLHYLHPALRAQLLNSLMDTAINNGKVGSDTRLNISYEILKRYADAYSGYEQCIKKYLFSHVRSGFEEIHPQDWGWVVLLPTQEWSVNPNVRSPKSPPYM